jgi:hypothetical protein
LAQKLLLTKAWSAHLKKRLAWLQYGQFQRSGSTLAFPLFLRTSCNHPRLMGLPSR